MKHNCPMCGEQWNEDMLAALSGGARPQECVECAAKDFRIQALQDSIDGCTKKVQSLVARLREQPDVVCQHGTAMDVHCCNCHSGFLFDADSCVCKFEAAGARSPTDDEA